MTEPAAGKRPATAGKRPAKVSAAPAAEAKPELTVVRSKAAGRAKPVLPAKGRRVTKLRKAARTAGRRPPRANGKTARRGVGKSAGEPDRVVRIRELTPQDLCGKRTSVLQLFRVDERIDGAAQTHLVFFDRHGWYCYHGASCPVVGEVRKVAHA